MLPQAIHAFISKRPDVRISVDIRDRETIFHHVARSVAEIGMRRDHPLAKNDIIRLSDLRSVKIVRLERGTVLGDMIDRATSSLSEPLNWSIETRYCATACAFVEKGEEIAIVDEYSTRSLLSPNIIIKPLLPKIIIVAFVIHASDRPLSKMAKLIIADIKLALKDNL